jgi:rare lipoprotein A
MGYRQIASWILLGMLGTPLIVSLGIALALLVSTLTARAECGKASWYASGHTTAEGRPYDPDRVSVAHRSYRMGTILRIVDQATGRAIVARVSDRGPFVRGRIVDLSRGAADLLRMRGRGVIRVCVAVAR